MSQHESTSTIGRRGEDLAEQALRTHGYQIIARNWRCDAGEIDIIAQDGEEWVFVEVKLRRSDAYGSPEESVTGKKQSRLLQSGALYMQQIDQSDAHWRIDVVAIEMSPVGKVKRIEIHRDAVRAKN
jgi:putative endonuclease